MEITVVSKKQTQAKDTELGKLLKAKRATDSLTLRAAADRIGFDHGGLSELENGKRTPDMETIVKIHEGLKIPLEDLLRAAAKDKGVKVSDRTNEELAAALTARAIAFPDLMKLLRRLETTDPKSYRSFLMMAEVWERENSQDDE